MSFYATILLTFKTWRHVLTISPLAKYTAPSAVILLFLKTQNIHHYQEPSDYSSCHYEVVKWYEQAKYSHLKCEKALQH